MKIPGLGRPQRRVIVDPATGREFVEREPGVIVSDAPTLASSSTPAGAPARAYERGRERGVDEARRGDTRAYAAGRADARAETPARRRGAPLFTVLVVIVALIGAAWLYLAWREGSFARGGAVVDQQITAASDRAKAAGDEAKAAADAAKARTGQAVENAGQALKNQGEKIKQP